MGQISLSATTPEKHVSGCFMGRGEKYIKGSDIKGVGSAVLGKVVREGLSEVMIKV